MNSSSRSKPHADTVKTHGTDAASREQQVSSTGWQPPSTVPQQADPGEQPAAAPTKQRPPSAPHSSSQHQLPDLGFEDVDLDSPDAAVNKSRSDHAAPPVRNHIMPIPFMQPAMQGTSPSSAMEAADFSASVKQYAAEPDAGNLQGAPHTFVPPAAHALPTSEQAPSADVEPTEADGHITLHQGTFESHHALSPERFQEVPSAARAGPFSTYNGPPSTSSSTPASPGSGTASLRRPSFLPRGMSTHLQKALRATAAAASKASAAIAPPPNSTNSASSPSAQQLDTNGKLLQAGMQQSTPFQQQWGQAGPASSPSTSAQERSKEGQPWWQQQLRNLQHNLHTPPQLLSDDASDSDVHIATVEGDTFLSEPGGQPAWADSASANVQLPDVSAWDASQYQAQLQQGEAALQLPPQHANLGHALIGEQPGHPGQHEPGLDSMPIMHHLPNENISLPGEDYAGQDAAAAVSLHNIGSLDNLTANADLHAADSSGDAVNAFQV